MSIERILEQAKQYPQVRKYLPEDRDMHKVPRQWLINITYTLTGEPFRTWVKNEIESRNLQFAKKQKLLIEMDEEVARAFYNSSNISSKSKLFTIGCLLQVLIDYISYSFKW